MKERVRAIIIRDQKIILIKRVKPGSIYYVFPGGGVEDGEDKISALVREVKEELGLDVRVSELIAKRRYDQNNQKQMEYFYLCNIIGGVLGTGDGPEFQANSDYEGRHEVIQVSLDEAHTLNILPREEKDKVIHFLRDPF